VAKDVQAKTIATVVSKTDNRATKTKATNVMSLKQLKEKFPQYYYYRMYGVCGLAHRKQQGGIKRKAALRAPKG
jgi:hypothetical protein